MTYVDGHLLASLEDNLSTASVEISASIWHLSQREFMTSDSPNAACWDRDQKSRTPLQPIRPGP